MFILIPTMWNAAGDGDALRCGSTFEYNTKFGTFTAFVARVQRPHARAASRGSGTQHRVWY